MWPSTPRPTSTALHTWTIKIGSGAAPSRRAVSVRLVSRKGDTLRVWMPLVMTRCGVDAIFTGGSIRQAASSKAINDGWEPAAVLALGIWKPFAKWNRFYNRS